MSIILLNFEAGDPIWLQKLMWQLSHPAFWFVLLKWFLVFIGVVLVAFRLLKAKRFFWFALFLLTMIVVFWGIYELSQQATQSFREGRGREVIWLRIIGYTTDIVAIFVVVRILYVSFAKKL